MNPQKGTTSVTSERWQRIESIFHTALNTEEPERTEFVRTSSEGDEGIFAEVQTLLEAFLDEKKFISPPVERRETGRVGGHFGGYQLDRVLGQGGMGSVYLAHRADGQFEQQVAIKLVSAHLSSEFFSERFRTERQILAGLNHPNITRLLDGGVGSDGDPYLVMEYVDGQPLNRYCDEHSLSIPERIRLFLQVCSAVEYAHRNLIVHRDLKPGNILVTKDGVPKLLDFGTAKLLSTAGDEPTNTRFGMITPRYASPEQLRGELVTTLTDVYSLGVVLYEIMTGAWPFGDPDSLISGLERAVREVDPTRPKHLITDDSAKARSTSKARLARLLDGDLHNIIAKALQSAAERRYKSVEQFSDDLQRYLDGEPVLARPRTMAYRTGKFVRRNWVAVSAAALFVAGLCGSAVYSARQAQTARREADKATSVTEFLTGVLESADPAVEGGKANMTVLEAVDGARSRLDEFNNQPQIKGYLQRTLGIVYSSLAAFPKAEEQLRSALAIERKTGSDEEVAWVETGLGNVLTHSGKSWDEAEGLYREAVAIVRKQGKKADPRLVHVALGQYAVLLWMRHGHSQNVESLATQAVDIARSAPSVPRPWLAIGDYVLAQYLIEENRDEEARKLLTEALSVEARFARPTSALGSVLSTLASLRAKQGDFVGAEAYQRQYRDEMLRQLGPEQSRTIEAMALWAVSWSHLGHTAEASQESAKALEAARRLFPAGSWSLWRPLVCSANVLNDDHRGKEAESLARESLESIRNTNPMDPRRGQSWAEIGVALLGQRRFKEAVPALQSSEQIYLALPGWGPKHYETIRVHEALAAARAGLATTHPAGIKQ